MDIKTVNTEISGTQIMAQKAKLFGEGVSGVNAKVMPKMPLAKKYQMENVSRGFESIFVHMMYKQMKQSMLSDSESEGMTFGKDTLDGYSDMAFAEQLSSTGRGIGIAEKVYEFLTGEKDMPSLSKSNNINELENEKSRAEFDIISSALDKKIVIEPESSHSDLKNLSSKAADKYNLPVGLLNAIIQTESSWNPNSISKAGAKGLMQLMDPTAAELGVSNSFDPKENIDAGARYFKSLLDRFKGDYKIALAAYNSGIGNVEKYNGIPPFKETSDYLIKISQLFDLDSVREDL
ncbi:MAG: hypothetical protein Kapaf2KO_17020 [Candidatus Kapaibacteriales bacterium]